ncbi:ShlB/FhaC/HecB family hemolysin secretion/activation protein [Limnohabitans sp.]|jgi:hemolysin activation/secretion protein|uniref:ShlB/FhaC/HecB family hemolysin secretion/activation protein n=1 Tax=Limnohabitans sp. TaxID=1907725 RepID=UPI0037BF72B5
MTSFFSMPRFAQMGLATLVAASGGAAVSAAPPDTAAAHRLMQDLGLQLRAGLRPQAPAHVDTLGLVANTPIDVLVAVQVKSAVLPDTLESFWRARIGGAVSVDDIRAFHAWFDEHAAQKGFTAYAKTEVLTVRGGQQLNIQVVQPKLNSVRIVRPENPQAAAHLASVQTRVGRVFQAGLPLDTVALSQVLDSAAYGLPIQLEASLSAVSSELIDLRVNILPAAAMPDRPARGGVMLATHGLREHGQPHLLAALTLGMPAAKSQLALLAQAAEGLAYLRADYEGLWPQFDARWTVFGTSLRQRSVTHQASATEGEVAEFGMGLSRNVGSSRDRVYQADVLLFSRASESRRQDAAAPPFKLHDHQWRWRWAMDNERLSRYPMRAELSLVHGYHLQAASEAVRAGHYARVNAAFKGHVLLNHSGSLRLAGHTKAQWASRNLSAHNQIALGGVQGVRAYTSADGVGDHGFLVSAALIQDIGQAVSVSAFYDGGRVQLQADPLQAASVTRYALQAVGVQLQGQVAQLHYTLTWARGQKSHALGVPHASESKPVNNRADLALSYLF